MGKLLSLIMLLIFMYSCADVKDNKPFRTINIAEFEDTEIDFASYASKVDTLFFLLKEEASPVSSITSFDFGDSVLVVVDVENRISLFDMHTGELLKQAKKIGHATDEYLQANVVKCVADTIFIMDTYGRKVIKYDKNLNFIENINLNFMPLDFEVTKNGLLFSKLDVQEKDKRFVWTDQKGNVKNLMVDATPLGSQLATLKSFLGKTSEDVTYFHEPMSDTIYKWENGKAEPAFAFSFPEHNGNAPKEEHTAILRDCFVTTNNLICSFIYNNKGCFAIYSRTDEKMIAGSFDLNSGRPFSPMIQKGNRLFGLFHTKDSSVLKNWKPKVVNSELTMLVYHF